jgi:dTDP-glucose 4,6-dehydratase
MPWLVTGGAGFIGSNLVRRLVTQYPDQKIINFDSLTYAGNLSNLDDLKDKPNYTFVRGDITDQEFVEQVVLQHEVDGIFHLAAESHVDRSILGPGAFIEANIKGTFALLEVVREHWINRNRAGRFLHVSTDEVYGSLTADDPAFSETTPYQPNSPYSASKAASDHLVRAYHHTYGLNCVTTNCSNNYGPWQFPEKLIPVVIGSAKEGKPIPVYGDGKNVRDWLFVEDHCEALDIVFQNGKAGEVYNIGGNNEWNNLALVEAICDLVDEIVGPRDSGPRRELITFVKDRPGHDQRYAIDATKIESELGWKPNRSFQDALRMTIQWYLDHSEWLEACRSGAYREYYEQNYGDR